MLQRTTDKYGLSESHYLSVETPVVVHKYEYNIESETLHLVS